MAFFPGFDINVETFIEKSDKTVRARRKMRITVTEVESQKSVEKVTGPDVANLPVVVGSLILKSFPDTKASQGLIEARGLRKVRLPASFEGGVVAPIHIALRKHCEGQGSSLWYRLIADMPAIATDALAENILRELNTVGIEGSLRDYGCALRTAFEVTFSAGARIDRNIGLHSRHIADSGWSIDALERMTLLEIDRLSSLMTMCHLAVGYLSSDDWRDMLTLLVEEVHSQAQ